MLQFFEDKDECKVFINNPLTEGDTEGLKNVLNKNFTKWSVEYGAIFIIKASMIELLYNEIFEKKKKISLITHKAKLNRYLRTLGFRASFESGAYEYVKNTFAIDTVLIGGSADSSSKIINIVKNVAFENLTLVLVQHVEPNRVGIFDEILKQYSDCKISYAKDGQKIQKQHIYLAPNNKHLMVENGYFKLSDEEKYNYSRPSISLSYASFSNYYKKSLLVIQECGYAQDGVDKLELLRENETKIIIQDRDECEAKPMINNALALNQHDYIFKQKDIIDYLNFLDKKESSGDYLEYLLRVIYQRYGYDFKLYNRDMIQRRLEIFMIKNRIKSIKDALGFILFHKTAFKSFLLEVSINVTEFFRNPNSFKDVAQFLDAKYHNKYNLKVWSAGCSTGKEAYSMSIILESLGMLEKSILYATDFNNVVIDEAKNGIYACEAYMLGSKNFDKMGLSDKLSNYVYKNENFVIVNENIKKKTLFFQHNLVEDSSFNEFDIIICKNVIIYFSEKLQEKVFKLFYDSLKFGGHLVLGESEGIHSSFVDKFDKCSENSKIYMKVS